MCNNLQEHLKKLQCEPIFKKQTIIRNGFINTQTYIKSFFTSKRGKRAVLISKRIKRSWKFWDDMDGEDRARIDKDMDTLRKNEEKLKDSLSHQTSALNEMYDLVTKSVLSVDNETLELVKKFEILKGEVEKDSKFVNGIKQEMYLESTLVGLYFWIEQITSSIKLQQERILNILLGTETDKIIIETLGTNFIKEYLDESKLNLPERLSFPKRLDGNIDPTIIKIIEFERSLEHEFKINMKFKVPLVQREPLTTRKVTITPQLNGSTVTTIKVQENIILNIKDSTWGYIIKEDEIQRCEKIGNIRICQTRNKETNIASSETCVSNIIYRNETQNCEIKMFKIAHELWLETENQNRWRYIAPKPITIEISVGQNKSTKQLEGVGIFTLTPNMSIKTDNIILDYFEEVNNPITFEKYEMNFNSSNITMENWITDELPVFKLTEKTYSLINKKKLFELGVDVNQIKSHKTVLENLKYAPYKYPWWVSSSTLGIGGLILIFLACRFRGKLSCCERHYIGKEPDKLSETKQNARRNNQKNTKKESIELSNIISNNMMNILENKNNEHKRKFTHISNSNINIV